MALPVMVLNAAANQCERAIAGCCALPAKGHAAEQRYDRHLRNYLGARSYRIGHRRLRGLHPSAQAAPLYVSTRAGRRLCLRRQGDGQPSRELKGHSWVIAHPAKMAYSMSEADSRKIIHVDMDAFYASVEQRDDPSLRGRPVAVGHAAKRGVVASASYEARTFGVRSAMPSSTALRKCPDLVFVPPRFEVYRAVSHQIRAIFADYTALIEPLSLDEAYLDVSENLRGIPTASATAAEIRARIFDETGLTASAGISYNKFLAKLASDHCKPNGQFVVTPAMTAAFVETLPIGKFHGVGPVTAKKMKRLGIFTGADLRRQSLEILQQHFGKSGIWYHAIANGEDNRPIVPDRPRKSSGSE